MLGFKRFRNALATISGIELMHRIRKGQFDLTKLGIEDAAPPAEWSAVLSSLSDILHILTFSTILPICTRTIYTTNALESVNAGLRKIIRTRGHFPSDEAATTLLWLVLRNITAGWARAAHDCKAAMNQFAILYEERFTHPYN
ncbi:transposase [Robbsia andropogonis]|uniref:transposase n=1 Tax=Robbsia andropogonis TaxID=28092 RepID=UPI002A6A6843|nr:transposase [Robbsia andropogonis]